MKTRVVGTFGVVAFAAGALAARSSAASAQDLEWSTAFAESGLSGRVETILTVYDAALGHDVIYVGGSFAGSDAGRMPGVVRFDGTSWSPLGSGISVGTFVTPGTVSDLEMYDDGSGSGPSLLACGSFRQSGGQTVKSVARWDGTNWIPIAGPTGFELGLNQGPVLSMCTADLGAGPVLFVVGWFSKAAGVPADNIATWDGTSWSALPFGLDTITYDVVAFDDGSGPAIYAGGYFSGHISKWDGFGWQLVGGGVQGGGVHAMAVFDDGSGPALFATGNFDTGGGVSLEGIGKWDGQAWSALGGGLLTTGEALTVFDDGSGSALYVSGTFTSVDGGLVAAPRIARWNGSTWQGFGGVTAVSDVVLRAVAGADFGPGIGRKLVVGGNFDEVVEVPPASNFTALEIAAWDGRQWERVGTRRQPLDDLVDALCVHDFGSGAALFAGGQFKEAGGVPASRIASWNGVQWSALGAGLDDEVTSLVSHDDGSGPALYAGGRFDNAGGSPAPHVARWDGASWSALGTGTNNNVLALTSFDDGSGSGAVLVAGGSFATAGGAPAKSVARWDGQAWSALGEGLNGNVFALATFDHGSGPELYAGGQFQQTGNATQARFLARFDGAHWQEVGGGTGADVRALYSFDDGTGPALYVGGKFGVVGAGLSTGPLARWNGSAWSAPVASALSGPLNRVRAFTVFDDGTGPALYATGSFGYTSGARNVGKISGGSMLPLGVNSSGPDFLDEQGNALAAFDDGSSSSPSLFAGGEFTLAGQLSSHSIARWGESCAQPPTSYCTAGTTANGCNAHISATGVASVSQPSGFDVTVGGVEGAKLGVIFWGLNPNAVHWGGGSSYACVAPPTVRTGNQFGGGTAGQCDGVLTLDFDAWLSAHPGSAAAAGATVYMQGWFRDPPSPKATSLSDAMSFRLCP